MYSSHTDVSTESASRYINRLCKHWSHKFAVDYDAQRGEIKFDPARCLLQVIDAGLRLTLETPDEQELAHLQEVVAEHLQRMASSEQLAIQWRR
ncbi:DUF2218 domain-containing protein [Pseudomonas sp. 2FG]|uniref:DUF2218 domain-containing protein n=1 Tax=Pseudomonas sp. 2FG TaxID=2502191 RepID=UPI0010F9C6DE|nr:DUF2218 domain-containing protein [Pseudomonas sp. 2FG]